MDRRQFLQLAGGLVVSRAAGAYKARKPNFLVILADDMGFSDARCYGGDIDTPNLDRLAARGVRFTQAYSTARCGPSRSCLLTGYYAQQTASDIMTPGNVPSWASFIPEHLRPLGYRSYHSGKWHIRVTPQKGVGFDHSYTLLDEDRYFTPRRHDLDGEPLPSPKPEDGYYSSTAIADYAVKFLQGHAREHPTEPFFTYVAFHAPHFPLHAPQADIDRYKDRFAEGWDAARERRLQRMRRMGIVNCGLSALEADMWPSWNLPTKDLVERIGPGEVTRAVPWSTLTSEQKSLQRTKMAIHAAMITRMDTEIGKVLAQLKAMDAYQDTAVVFLSDNGASAEQIIRGDGHEKSAPAGSAKTYLSLGPGWSSNSNAPFRLHKSWVHEGGIASPLIVHWPNGVKDHNQLRHNPCHFVDVLPTLVDLAGGKPGAGAAPGTPPLAGRSLAPVLARDKTALPEFLYFNHNNNRAIRVGDWKLVAAGAGGPWELYDLSKDRCERENLAAANPSRVQQLAALWKRQDDEYATTRERATPTGKERMPTGG